MPIRQSLSSTVGARRTTLPETILPSVPTGTAPGPEGDARGPLSLSTQPCTQTSPLVPSLISAGRVKIVFNARCHLLARVRLSPEAADLGPARDAGFYPVPRVIMADERRVFLVVGHRVRPRPHQRDRPTEHVRQLREFVEAAPAQEPAHRGSAKCSGALWRS